MATTGKYGVCDKYGLIYRRQVRTPQVQALFGGIKEIMILLWFYNRLLDDDKMIVRYGLDLHTALIGG